MSYRCTRSAGPVVFALFAAAWALVSLLGVPAPSAAASGPASAGPVLSLLHQSPWVEPNPPGSPQTFTLELATGHGTVPADQVVVALYDHLTTRSNFEQTLTSPPTGLLDRTAPLALSALPAGSRGGVDVRIAIVPTATATPAPAAGAPTLDLHCQPETGTCPGVYPVVVQLQRPTGSIVAKLTTYLTYAEVTSAHPLRFAWVLPVAAPITIRRGTRSPADAVAPLGRATVTSLAGLAGSLQQYASVPLTVAAAPQTLQALRNVGGSGRQVVKMLAALSAGQQVHQFLAQPYVPIDLGALAGAGEPTEIGAQMSKGATVLQRMGVQTSPGPATWVATGQVGSALGTGLSQLGITRVVVPDTVLAAAGSSAGNGTWTSAFELPLAKGETVTACASDALLAAHFTADQHDPALAANQLLADLAMIHFEAPNTPTTRGVVAVPPRGWAPSSSFDDELLAGLQGNPDVQATTLDELFSSFPAPPTLPTRHLQSSGAGPVLPAAAAARISAARLRLSAFDSAVPGSPPILGQLDELLLASESDDLHPSGQSAAVAAFERSLDGQLALISFATERTITLTARTGPIPVTVLSAAPYTVTGTLSLSSDRFEFPQGASQQLVIDHPTNPVRVQVVARTSGDLPMEVSLESPKGGLLIARGELTVRSTATSVVGVVLTALALAVLLGWWVRTWRSGRRRKAAVADGGSSS